MKPPAMGCLRVEKATVASSAAARSDMRDMVRAGAIMLMRMPWLA